MRCLHFAIFGGIIQCSQIQAAAIEKRDVIPVIHVRRASFILAILQIINASIVLVVLLCYFLMYSLRFSVLSSKFYLIFIIPALRSCVTVFYRSLSVLCSLRLPVIIKVLSYLILSYLIGGDNMTIYIEKGTRSFTGNTLLCVCA